MKKLIIMLSSIMFCGCVDQKQESTSYKNTDDEIRTFVIMKHNTPRNNGLDHRFEHWVYKDVVSGYTFTGTAELGNVGDTIKTKYSNITY